MPKTNFTLGANIGIVLAETAQEKFLKNFDFAEAYKVFTESLGCDEAIAEKLFTGEYVLVPQENKVMVDCIKREELPEERQKDYPVLNAANFVYHIINIVTGSFDEFNGNKAISCLRDVRNDIYKDKRFEAEADISKMLFKDLKADVTGTIYINAREIAKAFVSENVDEEELETLNEAINGTFVEFRSGDLGIVKFTAYLKAAIYMHDHGENILKVFDYLRTNPEIFGVTSEIDYEMWKLKSVINFSIELVEYIKNSFEHSESLFRK